MPGAAPPDQLDLDTLDEFLRSHVGQVYTRRLIDMGFRYAKTCQDRREGVDSIRAAQGAIEAVNAVIALPDTLRTQLEKKGEGKLNAK